MLRQLIVALGVEMCIRDRLVTGLARIMPVVSSSMTTRFMGALACVRYVHLGGQSQWHSLWGRFAPPDMRASVWSLSE